MRTAPIVFRSLTTVLVTECPIIRNAGGRAQDAIRSTLVLDTVITMGEVIVIHHTGTTTLPLHHIPHISPIQTPPYKSALTDETKLRNE
jgi:hypothetical protein